MLDHLEERLTVTGDKPDFEELLDLLRRPAWHADAACKEAPPDVTFFPARGERFDRALRMCESCLVLNECRAWALAQGSGLAGIFGGMTAQARRLPSRGTAA